MWPEARWSRGRRGYPSAVAGIFEVDGVPVYAMDGDNRQTSARLTFAVGLVDEPLWARGVLHLIEHLAMTTAHDTPIEVNASVELEATEFYASGTPARVATFLREVCLGLATLPVERLEIEKSVLDAEDSWGAVFPADVATREAILG